LPWQGHGESNDHGNILPCSCHVLVMRLSCYCTELAMVLPHHRHVIAWLLPRAGHACQEHGSCRWLDNGMARSWHGLGKIMARVRVCTSFSGRHYGIGPTPSLQRQADGFDNTTAQR
jgi:hypothetical protein